MTKALTIAGRRLPQQVRPGGKAHRWLQSQGERVHTFAGLDGAAMQLRRMPGELLWRDCLLGAEAAYNEAEADMFRALAQGNGGRRTRRGARRVHKDTAFERAFVRRGEIAAVFDDLGFESRAFHITSRPYIRATARVVNDIVRSAADIHDVVRGLEKRIKMPFDRRGLTGLGIISSDPQMLSQYIFGPPKPIDSVVRACIEADETVPRFCLDVARECALVASALEAFLPNSSSQWVKIDRIPQDEQGKYKQYMSRDRAQTLRVGHVFVGLNYYTVGAFALDPCETGFRFADEVPYHRSGLRLGALESYYAQLASLALKRGDRNMFLQHAQRMVTVDPDGTAPWLLTSSFLRLNGWIAGIYDCIRAAFVRDPDCLILATQMGICEHVRGNLEGAKVLYRKVARTSNDPDIFVGLALVNAELGLYERAETRLRQARQRAPSDMVELGRLEELIQGLSESNAEAEVQADRRAELVTMRPQLTVSRTRESDESTR